MKPVRFHPDAEIGLTAEAGYYDERSPGLSERSSSDKAGLLAGSEERRLIRIR